MMRLFRYHSTPFYPHSFKNVFKSTMQAVLVKDSLMSIENIDKATLKLPRDIVVKVEATAVNRADILQKKGFYLPSIGESNILGLEASGIVVETGSDCKKFRFV